VDGVYLRKLVLLAGLPQLLLGEAIVSRTPVTPQVNPFVGTTLADSRPGDMGFYNGNTFPGAAYPMGMVQWSPDTPGAKGVKGGYWYPDKTITGFFRGVVGRFAAPAPKLGGG
jgi:putative alpha-1,2-mannosidase